MNEINPTTRCYPRTLKEAFPQDNENWIDPPKEKITGHDILMSLASILMYIFIAYLFVKD
jgi:hypothetical protein